MNNLLKTLLVLLFSLGALACGLPTARTVLEAPNVTAESYRDLAFVFELPQQPSGFTIGYDFYYKWYPVDSAGRDDFEADIEYLEDAVIDASVLNNRGYERFRSTDLPETPPAIQVSSEKVLRTEATETSVQVSVYSSPDSETPAQSIDLYRWYTGSDENVKSLHDLREDIRFAAGTTIAPEYDFSQSVRSTLKSAHDEGSTRITLLLGLIVVAHGRSSQELQPVYSPIVTPHYSSDILYEVDFQLVTE